MKDYKKEGSIKGSLNIDGNLILTGNLNVEEEIIVSGYIDSQEYLIEAGGSIVAGDWIKAGGSIKAGDSIFAHSWIKCRTTLSARSYIYAGLVTRRERREEDSLVECGKLISGKVEFGTLKELGLPEEDSDSIEDRSEWFKRGKSSGWIRDGEIVS